MFLTHQVGAELRKLAFFKGREAVPQFLARHQRQHRVAQILQPLVVDFTGNLSRVAVAGCALMRVRRVGQRTKQQLASPEAMSQGFLEIGEFARLHGKLKAKSKGQKSKDKGKNDPE